MIAQSHNSSLTVKMLAQIQWLRKNFDSVESCCEIVQSQNSFLIGRSARSTPVFAQIICKCRGRLIKAKVAFTNNVEQELQKLIRDISTQFLNSVSQQFIYLNFGFIGKYTSDVIF